MAILKVAVLGNPILREVAKPIEEKKIKSPEIKTIIEDMIETMFEYDGRGLAAPQVHLGLQLVVMLWDFDEGVEPYIKVLINPKIDFLTEEKSTFGEGCLSLPGLRGDVSRPKKIRVRGFNDKAEKLDFTAEGFAATVIQHECDHLLGKLYIDRMTDLSRFAFSKEYGRFLAHPATEGAEEGDE